MENFDALFESQQEPQERMSTEEWIEMKKQERETLYASIDEMADKTLSEPKQLAAYLAMQAKLGRSSVNNTLLVMAQKPGATYVATPEAWQERGRGIRKGEGRNAIKQFRQDKEYTRDDGTTAMGYKVERCFDVSQTYGRPTHDRATLSMPIKTKLKALMTETSVPVKASDQVPQGVGAVYSQADKAVYVARTDNWNKLFFVIARELARAEGQENTFLCDCTANIACARYGIPQMLCDAVPGEVTALEPKEKRELLGSVREAAVDMIERVDKVLYAERQQQKNQPER